MRKPLLAYPLLVLLLPIAHASAQTPSPSQPYGGTGYPVRISWGEPNQDGYVQATLQNESTQIIVGYAVSMVVPVGNGNSKSRMVMATDAVGALLSLRRGSPRPGPVCPLLLPSTSCVRPVRIQPNPPPGPYLLVASALIYEDGSIEGDRSLVAMFLATRESDADAGERWRSVIAQALESANHEDAVSALKAAADGGLPADRNSMSLRNDVQRAIQAAGNESAFKAALTGALRDADLQITECRRHLNPGRSK
jgi:hypothetical protein